MKNLIKSWFKNIEIKNKIIAVYIPLIIIPLFLISFLLNRIFSQNVINKTKTNIAGNSKLIINQVEGTLANAESCANMLTINLSKLLSQNEAPNPKDFSLLNININGTISKALVVFPDVDSAAFIDTNNNLYTNSSQINNINRSWDYYNMLNKITNTNGINVYFPMQKRNFLVTNENVPVLTIGKNIFDITSGETFGNLIVNIKETTFSKIFNNLKDDKSSTYFITDENNLVLSSSDPAQILSKINDTELTKLITEKQNFAEIINYKNRQMLITCESFNKTTWKLITATPISELTKDANKITNLVILITLLCLITALSGASMLSKVISKPIVELKNAMLKIQNENLDVELEIDSEDEIGSLSKGIKAMLGRVKDLIQKVNFEQKRKREYELALINSQIKPHFLYNTLDVIYVLCELGKYEDVKKTTKSLADFYRAALSKGNDIITIEEEFKNVKEYLFIQNIRYSDVFEYEISVSDSILNYSICKLTIQPIVENAIYHGLKQKRGLGKLLITASENMNDIVIKVKDDGKGMDEERIKQVLLVGKHKNNTAFGLYSVNERIKLYFGEDYGLNIKSSMDEGTEITITVPKRSLGDDINA